MARIDLTYRRLGRAPGGANAQTSVKEGPMEAWGRSPANPVGGWPTRSQE
jgi:hypothetical protein